MKVKLSLYYKTESSYSSIIPELSQMLESLKIRQGVEVELISSEELTSESMDKLEMSVRNLPSQRRGEIVTSRGNMLPFSKGKKLNLNNTPILLVERDGVLTDVFPKRTQDRYMNVSQALLEMVEQGLQPERTVRSAEDLARSRLVEDRESIEAGLELVGEEVQVGTGKIDLLWKDGNSQFLVVELKREAGDAAIGQVVRLSASLAQQEGIPFHSVRKMLVCARINAHVELGARSVDIEVRKIPSMFLDEASKHQA